MQTNIKNLLPYNAVNRMISISNKVETLWDQWEILSEIEEKSIEQEIEMFKMENEIFEFSMEINRAKNSNLLRLAMGAATSIRNNRN